MGTVVREVRDAIRVTNCNLANAAGIVACFCQAGEFMRDIPATLLVDIHQTIGDVE
jgi:hypothetical protein